MFFTILVGAFSASNAWVFVTSRTVQINSLSVIIGVGDHSSPNHHHILLRPVRKQVVLLLAVTMLWYARRSRHDLLLQTVYKASMPYLFYLVSKVNSGVVCGLIKNKHLMPKV